MLPLFYIPNCIYVNNLVIEFVTAKTISYHLYWKNEAFSELTASSVSTEEFIIADSKNVKKKKKSKTSQQNWSLSVIQQHG